LVHRQHRPLHLRQQEELPPHLGHQSLAALELHLPLRSEPQQLLAPQPPHQVALEGLGLLLRLRREDLEGLERLPLRLPRLAHLRLLGQLLGLGPLQLLLARQRLLLLGAFLEHLRQRVVGFLVAVPLPRQAGLEPQQEQEHLQGEVSLAEELLRVPRVDSGPRTLRLAVLEPHRLLVQLLARHLHLEQHLRLRLVAYLVGGCLPPRHLVRLLHQLLEHRRLLQVDCLEEGLLPQWVVGYLGAVLLLSRERLRHPTV